MWDGRWVEAIYFQVILLFHLSIGVAEVAGAVFGEWRFAVVFAVEMQQREG